MQTEPEVLLLDVNETARALSCGRTTVYGLIADGKLDTRKLGRRTLVTAESVRRLVDSLPEADLSARREVNE